MIQVLSLLGFTWKYERETHFKHNRDPFKRFTFLRNQPLKSLMNRLKPALIQVLMMNRQHLTVSLVLWKGALQTIAVKNKKELWV